MFSVTHKINSEMCTSGKLTLLCIRWCKSRSVPVLPHSPLHPHPQPSSTTHINHAALDLTIPDVILKFKGGAVILFQCGSFVVVWASVFMRPCVRIWRLFCHCLFLISPSFGASERLCSAAVAFTGYLHIPVSILRKSIVGRYRSVRVADGPITARCRFM